MKSSGRLPSLTRDGNMPAMLPLKICLPSPAACPPAGPDWLHEIKHDGFRMIARRDGERVQLISRRGIDWRSRFRPIVAAVAGLPVRSCIIDGEARVRPKRACRLSAPPPIAAR